MISLWSVQINLSLVLVKLENKDDGLSHQQLLHQMVSCLFHSRIPEPVVYNQLSPFLIPNVLQVPQQSDFKAETLWAATEKLHAIRSTKLTVFWSFSWPLRNLYKKIRKHSGRPWQDGFFPGETVTSMRMKGLQPPHLA